MLSLLVMDRLLQQRGNLLIYKLLWCLVGAVAAKLRKTVVEIRHKCMCCERIMLNLYLINIQYHEKTKTIPTTTLPGCLARL